MHQRRFQLLTLFVALLAVTAVAATAGGGTPRAGGKPVKAAPKHKLPIDLATYNAHRWIVQLRGAPLASSGIGFGSFRSTNSAASGRARMNVSSARSTAYVSRLQAAQRTFTQ